MTATNFLSSLTITAAALGNKFGVPVFVGGKTAFTDGKSITLPDVDNISTLGRNEILGYLIHECGHVRFTNMNITGKTPLQHELLNAIEDVRIEHEMAQIYGGARALMNNVHADVIDELMKNVENSSLPSCLGLYLCIAGANLMGNYNRRDASDAFRNRLVNDLGKSIVEGIDNCLKAVPQMRSTRDAKAIVDEILKLLENFEDEKQEDNQESNEENQSQAKQQDSDGNPSNSPESSISGEKSPTPSGEEGTESSTGKCSESNEGEPNGESSESSNSSEGTPENGTSSHENDNSKSQSSSSQAGKDDKAQAIQQLIDATEKDLEDLAKMDISTMVKQEINKEVCKHGTADSCCPKAVKASPFEPTNGNPKRSHSGRIEQAKADSTYARRALQGLIQARTRASTRTARSGTKLSTTNMSRLATWNLRVFEKRTEHKAVNTAVHILLDMSGSMARVEETAIRSSLALTTCLTTFTHVNPALSVFPGNLHEVFTVLPHGQRLLRKSEEAIAGLGANGGTPLSEALLTGAIALSLTREERKVIIVVTDGFPDDETTAKPLIKKLQDSGVILIGIGIGRRHNVSQLFKHHVSIDKVEDLQSKFFTIARELFV